MALVRLEILLSTSAGSRPSRSGSDSQKTGSSPNHNMGTTEAQKVADGTRISSPGCRSKAKNEAVKAAVPLQWASAKRLPERRLYERSRSRVIGWQDRSPFLRTLWIARASALPRIGQRIGAEG